MNMLGENVGREPCACIANQCMAYFFFDRDAKVRMLIGVGATEEYMT